MKLSDIMGAAGLSIYAQIALVIFVGIFACVVAYLFLGKNRAAHFERAAMMPLDDDHCVTPRHARAEAAGNEPGASR